MAETNEIRRRAVHGLQSGDTFTLTRTFTEEETLTFGDLTRDFNPVHYDRDWSASKGFDGLICHGLLVGAMICEVGGQLGWLATGMNFRFRKPVYFGDTVTCTFALTRVETSGRAEAEATFVNQRGVEVATAGLSGLVPVGAARGLLQTAGGP